jgi:sugar lactone lactonase YvrE
MFRGIIGVLAIGLATPLHALPTIPLLRPPEPGPNAIVAAGDGTVYFVDAARSLVWRMLPDGQTTPFVTGTTGTSLQIDAGGNIYGTHSEGRGRIVVWKADARGNVMEVGRARNQEDARRLLAVRAGGRNGSTLLGSREVDGLTRTRTGELIITAGPAIRRVGLDGRVTTIASGGEFLGQRTNFLTRLLGSPSHLTGVAVCGQGDIYVANVARGTVVRVERDGRMQEVYTSEPGWRPAGVAAAGSDVYVLEYGAGVRVKRLEGPAEARIVARPSPARTAAAASLGWSRLPI